MDVQISLKRILKKGYLDSELEFQRASIVDRKLRLLMKDYPELAQERKQLTGILIAYENKHWNNSDITDQQVEESELAVQIAEYENRFYKHRKQLIRSNLKERDLTQKQLGMLLGHSSETYMSELVSGINPFTLNDLILIHKLLGIGMDQLIPATLNIQTIVKVRSVIAKLNNPKINLDLPDLRTA